MKKHSLSSIIKMTNEGEKFTCLTAYDYTFTRLFNDCGVETLLVGDSLGMTIQGQSSTLPVTVEDIAYHTRAVAKGNSTAFIIADMPFMSYHSIQDTLTNAGILMRSGAEMVKLEGGSWLCDHVKELSRNGVPSCIHMGLTPQSVNKFGGYRVQGRDEQAAQALLDDAKSLEAAGADFLLLECVPAALAKQLTEQVNIPVIGIGAGSDTDGQVLVCYDMLGLNPDHNAKFVRNFMAETNTPSEAVKLFVSEVKAKNYPAQEHCYL